ncbi:hypothetical protein IQ218_11555 [Synechocystis salina LEGE 06099]|uniref:hypothetical protein n=1 Tax=Synechocystis salina TaxID=945780 RepID=UPI00187F116C|nr:hypothetical protein [Synechocystis salina]MBE9203958.1 hypothetical protein [Synechocystis salina LEGE 06099]
MTDYSAVDKSSFASSESDYIQAELMAEEETRPRVSYDPGESSLAPLDQPLEATESFEFNFIDRPVPQEEVQSAYPTEEILTRLFTPWSLAGLLMLVAANGLLTVYSLTARSPVPTMAVANFDGLPPIAPGLPPVADAGPGLNLQKLSEMAVVHDPQPAVPSAPQAIANQNVANVPSAPPSTMVPPAQPVPMAGYSPYLNDPGYGAAAPGNVTPPRPNQSGQPLPTIAIQPIRQAPTPPLPPPPPPPINTGIGNGVAISPPVARADYGNQVSAAPSSPSAGGTSVESQMHQQLPSGTSPSTVASGGDQSFNQKARQQLTRTYNQAGGATDRATNPATQQLVQELESLNQAPY